jgi:hypothetical protein
MLEAAQAQYRKGESVVFLEVVWDRCCRRKLNIRDAWFIRMNFEFALGKLITHSFNHFIITVFSSSISLSSYDGNIIDDIILVFQT